MELDSSFKREFSGDEPPAPVLCLTATAKPEVVRDIREHFHSRLGVELMLLDGGATRTNLSFAVLPTEPRTKPAYVLASIEANLPAGGASGAVIYCATRSATERVAAFLKAQGLVATPGEIVREEKDREFERDRATADTRGKTAVSWLEEARLLSREENRVHVFPSSLRIRTVAEATAILDCAEITGARRRQFLDIVRHVMNADRDAGISTDELTSACGLSGAALRKAMSDLETLGIASDDTAVTVFVHVGVEDSALRRLEQAARLEAGLLALLREAGARFPDPRLRRHGRPLPATRRRRPAGRERLVPLRVWRLTAAPPRIDGGGEVAPGRGAPPTGRGRRCNDGR